MVRPEKEPKPEPKYVVQMPGVGRGNNPASHANLQPRAKKEQSENEESLDEAFTLGAPTGMPVPLMPYHLRDPDRVAAFVPVTEEEVARVRRGAAEARAKAAAAQPKDALPHPQPHVKEAVGPRFASRASAPYASDPSATRPSSRPSSMKPTGSPPSRSRAATGLMDMLFCCSDDEFTPLTAEQRAAFDTAENRSLLLAAARMGRTGEVLELVDLRHRYSCSHRPQS